MRYLMIFDHLPGRLRRRLHRMPRLALQHPDGLLLRFLYRAIKRPIEQLTEQADHVARVELPSVIEGMRSGEIDHVPEIEEIPVESKDEVGRLVTAFNDMHRSAVDLAAETGVTLAAFSRVDRATVYSHPERIRD